MTKKSKILSKVFDDLLKVEKLLSNLESDSLEEEVEKIKTHLMVYLFYLMIMVLIHKHLLKI